MKLIVGLGNIGEKYSKTRHNLGFMVLDELIKEIGVKDKKKTTDAIIYTTNGKDLLVYPKLMMNNSGKVVLRLVSQFNIDPEDILVVRDDIDLEFGKIRGPLNMSGSGGHQGAESIIKSLANNQFFQLKMGFGRPEIGQEVDDFVLEKISDEQEGAVNQLILETVRKIKLWIEAKNED